MKVKKIIRKRDGSHEVTYGKIPCNICRKPLHLTIEGVMYYLECHNKQCQAKTQQIKRMTRLD